MLSAAETRKRIAEEERLFEERANVIAEYLIEEIAARDIEMMTKQRKHEWHSVRNLDAYRPAMEKIGLADLHPHVFGDEWDLLTKRARELANEQLCEAGYSSRGFYEERDPYKDYYVLVLELAC